MIIRGDQKITPAEVEAVRIGHRSENEIEALLAELWQELLHLQHVGRNDRLLDLGGDSIVTAQIVARVERAFDLEFELVEFFDAPTLAAQAALVESRLPVPDRDASHG